MSKFLRLLQEISDEFSTKGHADIEVRPNAPRFADNPLDAKTELDEFDSGTPDGRSVIDRLHDLLHNADIRDQEIKQGIKLTRGGLHKVAARLGVGPHDVSILLASLGQQLRDDEEEDGVEENYHRFLEAEVEDQPDPFARAAETDHFSAEPDYLGDVTVRSAKRGTEKYYQGSQAANIIARLHGSADEADTQDVLRPLAESSYAEEIRSESGTYNFPWKLHGHTGFGTALYSTVGQRPRVRLVSVRDEAGEDVDTDPQMRQNLLAQAKRFIGDA